MRIRAFSVEPSAGLSNRRTMALALAALAVLLVIAWIDGGEEPIHPIAVEIPTPEQAG